MYNCMKVITKQIRNNQSVFMLKSDHTLTTDSSMNIKRTENIKINQSERLRLNALKIIQRTSTTRLKKIFGNANLIKLNGLENSDFKTPKLNPNDSQQILCVVNVLPPRPLKCSNFLSSELDQVSNLSSRSLKQPTTLYLPTI